MKRKTQGLACLAGGLLLTTMAAPMAGQSAPPRVQAAPRNAQAQQAASRLHSPEHERISPADARRLQDIIRRERQRYGHLLPQPGMTGPMLNAKQPLRAAANNQWVNIGPFKADYAKYGDVVLPVTDAGEVGDFATDPLDANVLYVAFEQGGLWKSMDGGNSWRPKLEHLNNLSASAIAIDPSDSRRILLGQTQVLGGAKVLRSGDSGESWTEGTVLGEATQIFTLLQLKHQPNTVVVATDRGVFRSVDGAATFSKLAVGNDTVKWREASIAWTGGNTLILGVGALDPQSAGGSLWQSLDNGANWSQIQIDAKVPVSLFSVASAPSNPLVVYAMAGAESSIDVPADLAEIFKSTDGGVTWSGIAKDSGAFKAYSNGNSETPTLANLLNGAGDYSHMLAVDPTNPERVYFGGGKVIASTADGGRSFQLSADYRGNWGLPYVHATAKAMHFARDGAFYLASMGGMARSRDSGVTWTQSLNQGLATHSIAGICSGDPAHLIALTYGGSVRVRSGTTGTFNQERIGSASSCVVDPTRPQTSVLQDDDNGMILKSVDGGRSWREACQGLPVCAGLPKSGYKMLWSARRAEGLMLYTYAEGQLFKSSDFAESWEPVSANYLGSTFQSLAVAPSDAETLSAITVGAVEVSSDGGATWVARGPVQQPQAFIHTVAFDPTDSKVLYVASRSVRPTFNHMWRSNDFGVSWKPIDLNGFPTGIHVYDLIADPTRAGTLYAGTFLGVYRSSDRGDTWQRFGQGLPMIRAYDLSLTPDGNTLHVGTGGRGVWEIALDDGGNNDGLQNGVPLKDLAGAKASEQFWTMTVPANASTLRFVTAGGSGDADLYVKFGSKPSTSSYDCRSNRSSNTESCVIRAPQAGIYHVMLRGWNAYSGVSLTGSYSTVARTAYSNETDIAIVDRGSVTSAIAVNGRSGNAPADTQVEVDIRHTYRGDLKVELLAPDGTAYLLHDRTGGSADDLRQVYTVDLSSEAISGEWKLRVTDLARGDSGHIDRWSITL